MTTTRHAFRDTTMPLTEREVDVLRLVARGYTNIQIADELGITFMTARNHVSSILTKLGVDSRGDAAAWWWAHGSHVPQPRRRSFRWSRALTGLAGMRTVATLLSIAGVAVAVVSIVVALVVAWPSSEKTPAANPSGNAPVSSDVNTSPSATSSSTAAAIPAPGETFNCEEFSDVCHFAGQIEQWLINEDADNFIAHLRFEPIACQDFGGIDARRELCEGARLGEVRYGFIVHTPSHGMLSTEHESRERLTALTNSDAQDKSDEFGSGSLRLARIGCPAHGDISECRDQFAVVMTMISASENSRYVYLYEVERSSSNGNSDDFVIMSGAVAAGEEVSRAVLAGGPPSGTALAQVFQDYLYFDPAAGGASQ